MTQAKLQNTTEELKPPFDLSKIEEENNSITPDELKKDLESKINSNEITGEDLLNNPITHLPFLVDSLLPQSGLCCLAGPSDTGKSMLLRMLEIAVVTGQNSFLGFPLKARYKSAIYCSTEDQERETSFLLRKQAHGYLPSDLKKLRFIFETTDLYQQLDKRLSINPADLIVIDCFADAFGQDLKDSQRIRTYLHPFQELASKHDTLILFLHHTGKRTEDFAPSKNNLLSGQGFEAKMRLVIELRSDLMNPNHRHLCVVKGNYLPAQMKRESFVLEFHDDRFIFENTGERIPFELLIKQPNEDSGKSKYEQAKDLQIQGQTYDQIASKLGYGSKGTVAKLFAKAKKNGWDVSSGNQETKTS